MAGDAKDLWEYWAHGAGAARIRWGVGGDWYRCVAQLGEHLADPRGYCEKMHEAVTGMTTSEHADRTD